ncbi:MAG: FAD-dependent oxidoreductase [Micrococcaceae bacterium]|nr:FAD-dependent oxidoreductase [Micrococcaceae bacterium]
MVSDVSVTEVDVVVVGGGAAGVAAAVSAARTGASVCLIEQYGFLGGAATNSSVLAYCGFFDQTKEQVVKGIGQDFLDELSRQDLYRLETFENSGNTVVVLDMETTKSTLDEMVRGAGVDLLLHSTVFAAEVHEGSIASVDLIHRGGIVRVKGKAFVDCSGDGALLRAAQAKTHLSDVGERQASTLVMRVGGVAEEADTSVESMDAALDSYGTKTGTRLQRSNGTCVRMPISREIMLLLVDQHVDALDARELTRAEIDGRVLARHYLEAFKGTLAGWDGAFLASTGPQVGIRESRRMIGLEAVSASDVIEARQRPEEAIARCGWPMEDHAVPGETSYSQIRDHKWYHIPYGAITSRNIGNLWAGGRLVSADNRAFASLRVMGTAFATGHGAGLAAAAHAENGRVDITKLRAALSEQGALV